MLCLEDNGQAQELGLFLMPAIGVKSNYIINNMYNRNFGIIGLIITVITFITCNGNEFNQQKCHIENNTLMIGPYEYKKFAKSKSQQLDFYIYEDFNISQLFITTIFNNTNNYKLFVQYATKEYVEKNRLLFPSFLLKNGSIHFETISYYKFLSLLDSAIRHMSQCGKTNLIDIDLRLELMGDRAIEITNTVMEYSAGNISGQTFVNILMDSKLRKDIDKLLKKYDLHIKNADVDEIYYENKKSFLKKNNVTQNVPKKIITSWGLTLQVGHI